MNVLISNECYDKYKIKRSGNPYNPVIKRNKQNGDINIDRTKNFSLNELRFWWQQGVLRGNDVRFKNPNTNRKIIENSGIYNRLLQQADALCLIHVNLDYVRDKISSKSLNILKTLRNEIKKNNWNVAMLIKEHPIDAFTERRYERQELYLKYIQRFNPKSVIQS